MATRNLTEPFILMRNNALQSKHIYAEQNLSDRMALVNASDSVELGGLDTLPPTWTDALEETQYILSRLRGKIDNLIELHAKQLTRPTLDDTCQAENQIDQLTREISRAFSNGYRQVQSVKGAARHETRHAERQLALSAALALSSALQELGLQYRTAQNHYVSRKQAREERNRPFFEEEQNFLSETPSDEFLRRQDTLFLPLEDSEVVVEREQEVGHIVQSISELNHIFKDLATMVHDQGSILDRIDYNIEQTQGQIQEGYKQLKKADSYQRANRKIYCIVILATSIILLSFIFILFKT